ncbi:unnamed protein product [Arctogadus glacialis]
MTIRRPSTPPAVTFNGLCGGGRRGVAFAGEAKTQKHATQRSRRGPLKQKLLPLSRSSPRSSSMTSRQAVRYMDSVGLPHRGYEGMASPPPRQRKKYWLLASAK